MTAPRTSRQEGLPVPASPVSALHDVRALLCDADGNLFPSEEPAFVASAGVTNRYLAALGIGRRYTAEELRLATTGKNFRTTARDLAVQHDAEVPDLAAWVEEEKQAVTAHLRRELRPDADVLDALRLLGGQLTLAAVSSSALSRLTGCFTATDLDPLIPPGRRFSAEDSLPTPTSKPDPAIYRHACAELGIEPAQGLAVEDSVVGATSAVRAGCPTIGNVRFVPPAERAERAADLRAAGVLTVVSSWSELTELVLPVLVLRARPVRDRIPAEGSRR
jgi:beta-phosphoglucomutase-like phosphatase (HAD superfamily)